MQANAKAKKISSVSRMACIVSSPRVSNSSSGRMRMIRDIISLIQISLAASNRLFLLVLLALLANRARVLRVGISGALSAGQDR